MKNFTCSVILPIHNGQSTLFHTLESLLEQKTYFDSIVVIDDGSFDKSREILEEFKPKFGKGFQIIQHKKSHGLAMSYNEGIKKSHSDLIITCHQDIILEKDSFKKLISPFLADGEGLVVASAHKVIHPYEIWKKYNFWQKVFFSRKLGKIEQGIDGKFDCFRREALKKAGFFNEEIFRTAGEDAEIIYKLKKIGRIVQTNAEIIHLHRVDPNFSCREIIRKQAQYSEAQGVLVRRGTFDSVNVFIRTFFRELLIFSLLIPYIKYFGLLLIIVYSISYTKKILFLEIRNPLVGILPFLNIYLLFVSTFNSIKGFILGKQQI